MRHTDRPIRRAYRPFHEIDWTQTGTKIPNSVDRQSVVITYPYGIPTHCTSTSTSRSRGGGRTAQKPSNAFEIAKRVSSGKSSRSLKLKNVQIVRVPVSPSPSLVGSGEPAGRCEGRIEAMLAETSRLVQRLRGVITREMSFKTQASTPHEYRKPQMTQRQTVSEFIGSPVWLRRLDRCFFCCNDPVSTSYRRSTKTNE